MVSLQALKGAQLFAELTDSELEKIAALGQEEVYEAGTIIFEEGEVANNLYIVVEGKVALEMWIPLPPHGPAIQTTIEMIERGQFFGWSALVAPHIFTLSAKCVDRTKVIAIDGSALRHLLDSDCHIGYKVTNRLTDTVSSRLRDTRQELMRFLGGERIALEYTPEEATLIQRIHYFIHFRWIAAIGVAVMALLANTAFGIRFPVAPVYLIAAIIALYNLLFWFRARPLASKEVPDLIKRARNLAQIQSYVDLLALTTVIHFSGGVENPFIFYFIFHIIIASILLPYRTAYLLATLAIFLLGSLIGLEYFGIIPHVHLEGFAPPHIYRQGTYILAIFFTFISALYISTYMATSIAGELRKRQREVVALKNRLVAQAKELEKANERLLELDRLRTYFMGMVSHDLKTPLVAIESYLQVILGGFAGEINEEQREMLDRSSHRIGELLNLISDLLDVSRIEAGQIAQEFKETSLSEVVEGSLEDIQAMAKEKEMNLQVEVPEDLPLIRAAPHRLQQVLNNLLNNAIKFTPPKGTVTLRVEDKDDYLQVEVMDTGVGIPSEDLPYVFDDFFRGRDVERTGAGLGLSIAKRIVEAHGGRIWAQSPYTKDGKGSKFTFTIPKTPLG